MIRRRSEPGLAVASLPGKASRRLAAFAVFCVTLLAGICVPARALMIPLPTTTLVDRASAIVEGKVLKVTCRWTDDHSSIISEVEIEPLDVLLGVSKRMTFFYEGGIVDGLAQSVSDMPTLKPNEQVLVYLREPHAAEARRDRQYMGRGHRLALLGASQGLHRIVNGRAVKAGFSLVKDSKEIDRDIDLATLKVRIRTRLAVTQRKGGSP